MIDPDYCRLMARYSAWQNKQLTKALEDVSLEDLKADHGTFFGSILATLNHILWADRMWFWRFGAPIEKPEGGIKESIDLCPTHGTWSAARFSMDGMISSWAQDITSVQLAGDLTFTSAVLGKEVRRPFGPCVMHAFNHQTHHRGQIHAMMTKTGLDAPVSDLFLMPEDA